MTMLDGVKGIILIDKFPELTAAQPSVASAKPITSFI